MAGPIQLTEVDFEQIKQNLIDYLKSTREFTDYDFSGSNLQVILNLIAYQSQLNAYTTNMVANESFLTSSVLRTNIVENASMLGYTPTSVRASVTEIDFELLLPNELYPMGYPTNLELQVGPTLMAGYGQGSFIFNTVDTQVSAVVSSSGVCRFRNVRVYEGLVLEKNFVVDYTDYNQKFILQNENIDTTTIRIEVQENPSEERNYFYTQANNLVALTHESKVYWLEETKDGHYEITFGDGFFGKKLGDGAKIFVTYLVSNGKLANGIEGQTEFTFIGRINDSFGNIINEPVEILRTEMTQSGADIETDASIKFRAPKHYAAQTRCVTEEDYAAIIRQIFPAVDDIYVFGGETLDIPQYGRVYIAIKPTTGDSISTITKQYIKKSLDPFRVGSLDIVFVDPDVVNVEVVSTVLYDERQTLKDSAGIVSTVKNTLSSYKDSSTVSKFGGTVRYSSILSMIDDSDSSITRNNTTLRLRKDIRPLMNTDASYEICFLNSFTIDCNNPVISSTGFQLEINNTVDDRIFYLEDDTKGKIRTFYYTANNEKVVFNEDFGTVDYEKGEILLGYQKSIKIVNVTEDNDLLKITAIPKSQDVVAKHTIFLNLDVANSPIGAVVDNSIARS